ncbi:ATP-dependent DNA ligase [Bacillus swezeyi]|uniref:ATP-dependent DNA ligase n=1 Tax=Bacillus swezeyi TaxID=1925020 RepID=A0A5M8RZT3_9BACI|nr:RNA ligase family protein [Bacillus swezeyi]KAA6451362.1 ATP-dependent DNA ligase [Bacillus swezeyi]KAA6482102.1 ATP-dependent DNA ligase [Bacillus swezeyi]TYS35579.1 ATP-dependent DNA ligase [Bacillus swezeyi]
MFISPMLLESAKEPFNSKDYITETKFDGIRLIASRNNGLIRLYTRHNNEVTTKFPELLTINIPDGTVLDGELIVPGSTGAGDFEAVMERFKSRKSTHPIVFCVFDVLRIDGVTVTSRPLHERKELLSDLKIDHPNIKVVEGVQGHATDYFELVRENKIEGIVMKRADSSYTENKRSNRWLKVVNYEYTDVFITGLRKEDNALLLSYLDGQYAGIMEFMPYDARRRLHSERVNIEETEKYVYIEPIGCRVKHRFKTKNGLLRIPSFHEWC